MHQVMGNEVRMGWAKPVPIPAAPVYTPESQDVVLDTGLPFNAQPKRSGPALMNPIEEAVVQVGVLTAGVARAYRMQRPWCALGRDHAIDEAEWRAPCCGRLLGQGH